MAKPKTPVIDPDQIQVSADGSTVWVHSMDGSTVGRFSKRFGMDVHNTITDQLSGAPQCLNCTHSPPSFNDWVEFVNLMRTHHQISVPMTLIDFQDANAPIPL